MSKKRLSEEFLSQVEMVFRIAFVRGAHACTDREDARAKVDGSWDEFFDEFHAAQKAAGGFRKCGFCGAAVKSIVTCSHCGLTP